MTNSLATKQSRHQNRAAPHNCRLHMMQSIFSPAARCTSVSLPGTQRRRDGGLKMDWTKPPAPHSPPGAWELGQHMGIA
jgi:hypothetical protein